MIKANELRIGNWAYGVMYPNQPLQIKTIHENIVHLGEHINGYDSLEPIPLTPEILEKCGFKKSLNGYCYGMITNDGKNRFSIFTDGTFKLGTQDLSVNILHIHQLQNLYFALTGEELKVNL